MSGCGPPGIVDLPLEQSAKINWVLNLLLVVCASGAGVYRLRASYPIASTEILAVGAILTAGVMLDLLLNRLWTLSRWRMPDSAELNAVYSRALSPVYILYGCYALLTAAALGVFQ